MNRRSPVIANRMATLYRTCSYGFLLRLPLSYPPPHPADGALIVRAPAVPRGTEWQENAFLSFHVRARKEAVFLNHPNPLPPGRCQDASFASHTPSQTVSGAILRISSRR